MSPEPEILRFEDNYLPSPWGNNSQKSKPSPGVPNGRSGSGNGHPGDRKSSGGQDEPNHTPLATMQPNEGVMPSSANPQTQPQRLSDQPESDAGSLGARMKRSTIEERNANPSTTTYTQRSNTSQSLKRSTAEMQGSSGTPQPEPRPTKQPYSPTSRTRPPPPARQLSRQHSYNTDSYSHNRQLSSPLGATSGLISQLPDSVNNLYETPKRPETSPVSPSSTNVLPSPEATLVKQPATRPITEQQLINEVKGIYAGLVMVERKCVDIINQQTHSTKRLNDQQWKALVALHRTLLQEHHDFFSASQHPSASDNLKKLAIKYAMPARMWRHGIHAFLELLRHRLPDSMEHMLSFIYLAYSMMALLKESVPSFVETWIECLGDLARYRMAIEDTDPKDREIWSNVAKMWYNEAADKSPNVGRIQHHLAVLARPAIVEQLFYYDKALISEVPFVSARESIMLLFDMFIKNGETVQARYPPTEYAFVNVSVILFTRGSRAKCDRSIGSFEKTFGGHIDRASTSFKLQGPQMIAAIFAGMLDFSKEDSHLWHLYCQHAETVEAHKKTSEGQTEKSDTEEIEQLQAIRDAYWRNTTLDTSVNRLSLTVDASGRDDITESTDAVAACAPLLFKAISIISSRVGDKNIVPSMHIALAILWDMSFVPGALVWIEHCIPWDSITLFLNTVSRSGTCISNIESDSFPPSHGGNGRQLPEDFLIRGMMITKHYYRPDFFAGPLVDEDDRNIELPSHQAPRSERCLWLGRQLTKLGRYVTYDVNNRQFETTEFAQTLRTMCV